MQNFKVEYRLKRFSQNENSMNVLPESDEVFFSETDDPHYIFVDLIDKHRAENVLGLSIINIIPNSIQEVR